MKVLIVCQSGVTNASVKQAMGFAEHLARRGVSVMLSCTGSPREVQTEDVALSSAVRFSFRRSLGPVLSRKTVAESRAFAPDVVHVFNPRHVTVNAARQLVSATNAGVVVHWEDDELGLRQGVVRRTRVRSVLRLGRRLLCYPLPRHGVFVTRHSLRWVRRNARICDALTPALAKVVEEETGLRCVSVLPVMLEPADEQAGPSPGVDAARFNIGFVGSIHTESVDDFRLAIGAVKRVRRSHPQAVLVHAGLAAPRFAPAKLAGEEGLPPDGLQALGYVPFGRVDALLRSCDALVQPGRPDRFNQLRLPSKVHAYLVSGTPTVMFSVGFGELLEDGTDVLKLRGFSEEELAGALERLIDEPGFAAELGAAGQRAAQRLFDPDTNVSRLVQCYEQARSPRADGSVHR